MRSDAPGHCRQPSGVFAHIAGGPSRGYSGGGIIISAHPVFHYASTSGIRHTGLTPNNRSLSFLQTGPVEDPHVHVLQFRGAVSSVSIASTDLLYYVEPLPLDQFIHHDTQTVYTWPETARQELFAVAHRDIAVARRNLASMTRYVDMQDAHLAACSGALHNNILLMTVETFPPRDWGNPIGTG